MEDKTLQAIIKELSLSESITLESIPNIDLYMDQVITLFDDRLKHTRRNEEDKLLTKTMINNYTKDKLLMPAEKKKYTKSHIILMILLYELKHILTISDIKDLFGTIIKEDKVDEAKLSTIYQVYLNFKQNASQHFENEAEGVVKDLDEQINLGLIEDMDQIAEEDIKDMLLVIMFIEKASYYKRLAEKIIDKKIIDKKTNSNK